MPFGGLFDVAQDQGMIACRVHRIGVAMKGRKAPAQRRCAAKAFEPVTVIEAVALRGKVIRKRALLCTQNMDTKARRSRKCIMPFRCDRGRPKHQRRIKRHG